MDTNKSALVLIDLQKESNFGIDNVDKVISNAKQVIDACRAQGIPVIYTRQINRTDGTGLSKGEPLKEDQTPFYYAGDTEQIEIFDEIKPERDDIIIDKYRWSAFYETSLDLMLKSLGVEHLFIGGLVSDGCLMTTVFDAYFRDYDIHLIEDICATTNEGAHMSSMLIMSNWVYNLSIYNTNNFVRMIEGKTYDNFEAETPDSQQFTPETMIDQFNKLKK